MRLLENKKALDLFLLGESYIRCSEAFSSLQKARSCFMQASQAILDGDSSFALHKAATYPPMFGAGPPWASEDREDGFLNFSFTVIEMWERAEKPEHAIEQALSALRRLASYDIENVQEDEDFDLVGGKRKWKPTSHSKTKERGIKTMREKEKTEDDLWQAIFVNSVKISDYQQAYAALSAMNSEEKYPTNQVLFDILRRLDSLEKLIVTLYSRQAMDTLLLLPFHLPGIKDKVKSILLRNARKDQPPVADVNSFYHALYAFNIHYQDYRGGKQCCCMETNAFSWRSDVRTRHQIA